MKAENSKFIISNIVVMCDVQISIRNVHQKFIPTIVKRNNPKRNW